MGPYFAETPWAFPGLVLVIILAGIFAKPLSSRIGGVPAVLALLIFGLAAPLPITLTPSHTALEYGVEAARTCHTSPEHAVSWLLATPTGWLNIFMFIPLGAAAALMPRARHTALLIAIGLAYPLAIETIQYATHPWLGRSCDVTDVLHNWLGLIAGLLIATAFRPQNTP